MLAWFHSQCNLSSLNLGSCVAQLRTSDCSIHICVALYMYVLLSSVHLIALLFSSPALARATCGLAVFYSLLYYSGMSYSLQLAIEQWYVL